MDAEEIKEKLVFLTEEHRDLDYAIEGLTDKGTFNQIQVQRLKKRKLVLRDQINSLSELLVPNIIA